jgi:uncharacterized protein
LVDIPARVPVTVALFTRRRTFNFAALGVAYALLRKGHQRAARPASPQGPLSARAQQLIHASLDSLPVNSLFDAHVHIVGLGAGGTGCYVGEKMRSLTAPLDRLKFGIYLDAAGVTDVEKADAQYIEQLVARSKSRGKFLIFAFDEAYDENGKVLKEACEFHTPNDYVLKLAKEYSSQFIPAASIHPYRRDAVDELERCAAQGAVAVKWLPNAMNIDPSNAKCDAFYEALARLHVTLITHAGEEKAVHAEEAQRYGNPLHLRRALEKGVTVVVAHCASLGQNPDLDNVQGGAWVDNFELFMRLMKEPQWNGKLFGDISAIEQVNRLGNPLETILVSTELQQRLVNGSDYPLPAINVLMQTRAVEKAGLITSEERELLNEIDAHNPLLFDLILKRTIRRGERKLRDSIFTLNQTVFPLVKLS